MTAPPSNTTVVTSADTTASAAPRRGGIDGLPSPHPLGEQLPAVFAQDEMMQRWVAGLDDLLAPLLVDLDCFDSYLRAALAPEDFVRWLGSWLGSETGPHASGPRLRAAVAAAARLHRLRGTAAGLAETVRLAFGVRPEIEESGGVTWSARPLGPFPGSPNPQVVVRLRVPDPASVDRRLLEDLVSSARPAHIPYRIEVLPDGSAASDGFGPPPTQSTPSRGFGPTTALRPPDGEFGPPAGSSAHGGDRFGPSLGERSETTENDPRRPGLGGGTPRDDLRNGGDD